ncbi:hypothetical protein CEUSTIGMA_g5025.t1 [Chlamydomonas eustigma]|uniref:MARVEL domain-containing protein n=1 Tax=Chlamydomonas eustigma TaxID=1157962 RepID=A0A250X3E8_9CHLO|nr:hypothetical protein CEUSTIGMA_g5025.t1 [Chlamydomonas eustigma]|eukprot:GAX77581.1 hypothetical protein CEUSTIGMA_g5025.t1 [Chlamydomonas eustigma]
MGCCSCLSKFVINVITWIFQVLKVATAIAIIIIVFYHLQNVNVVVNGFSTNVTFQCLLGPDYNGDTLCSYAYAVCGLSLLLNLLVSITLCFTCDLCGLGNVLELAFSGVGMLWWLAASIVFTKQANDANNNPLYSLNSNWRNSVTVLSWVTFGLFTFVFVVFFFKVMSSVCECCSCCDNDDEKKDFDKP